ncbi:DUF1405 domain-containing protein [Paenibacillus tarimensis]
MLPLLLLRFWSRSILLNRSFLWLLFAVNLAGTVYGYIWYWKQLVYTYENQPLWQIVFVPDSPTASLFFTVSLLFLLFPAKRPSRVYTGFRSVIEALAVVTSIKYGVWAVVMIFAGAAQGNGLVWQDWMLVVSHLGMAFEALLYVRFFVFGRTAAFLSFAWLLLNDTLDYRIGIYPWLPAVLRDDLGVIAKFTVGLTVASLLVAMLALVNRRIYLRKREDKLS